MARKKSAEFVIPKAQMQMMLDFYRGDKQATICSNRGNLELRFTCMLTNSMLTRSVMLALMQKGLLKFNPKLMTIDFTKLGLKIMKLKMKKPHTSGMTIVKPELMSMAREIKGALKLYNFLKV